MNCISIAGQEVSVTTEKSSSTRDVDLDEAAKLVIALEQDLRKVSGDSPEIQRLRDEVERLKNVLDSPAREHHEVRGHDHRDRSRLVVLRHDDDFEDGEVGRQGNGAHRPQRDAPRRGVTQVAI